VVGVGCVSVLAVTSYTSVLWLCSRDFHLYLSTGGKLPGDTAAMTITFTTVSSSFSTLAPRREQQPGLGLG
jgi:hypothetical protein